MVLHIMQAPPSGQLQYCSPIRTTLEDTGHPFSAPVVKTVHGKVLGKYISLERFKQPVAVSLGVPFANLLLCSTTACRALELHEKCDLLPSYSYPFLPTVIDGMVLPKTPEDILAEKNFNTVPYMVGINKQGFGWSMQMMIGFPLSEDKLDQKRIASLLWQSFPILNISESLIPAAIEKCLSGTEDSIKKKDLLLDLMGDVMFGVPSMTVSRGHRDAGAPTYMYEFQYRPSFVSDMRPKTMIGDHGDDLFSVWGAPFLKEGASEEETNLSKMVMKFWGNFARNGNSNGEGLPHCPQYKQKEGYLQIRVPTQSSHRLKDKKVAFWTELRAKKTAERTTQREHFEL
ncbi:LOW QUALITY PROTEIN: liver carboxylesterase 1-like [Phodopus roborovskii]|uniref:LOW QUALITY PROTEIN: liver carboxylesterase 1-like n=1 Tax=Phodopus roborovskii TaxID=109678 RepID=UPI0021E3D5F7|nr:LOW QUALITY PROTEIN: liver carboxylesterase 1-like [Phodopus roborovskii]